jgi:hypothetical protein
MAAFRGMIPVLGAALTLFTGLAGCVQMPTLPNPFSQPTPDQQLDKALDIGVVRDLAEVNNGGVIQLIGIGLVVGLDGTGGTPNGQYRALLEQQLRKEGVEKTKAVLDDPSNALVLVSAILPAGVRRGQHVDVRVELPPQSPAISLKGGYLRICELTSVENTKNIRPESGNNLLKGHVLARAKGHLLVGLGNPDDSGALRKAEIWGGASSLIERPYYFVLNQKKMQSAQVANTIANRLNLQFQDDPRKLKLIQQNRELLQLGDVTQTINRSFEGGFGKGEIAKATARDKEHSAITVRVPYAYRYNHERFLRVAMLLPLSTPPDVMTVYRGKLDTILLDPKHTLRAALRLEALGKESIPTLKKGLASPDPLVRFAAAESLSYLDATAGIEDLAKLAIGHPEMRAYAFIAMAGLDESICRQKLSELMTVDEPDLRCGAFRALSMLNEFDIRSLGDDMGSFHLQKVAGGSASLVAFAVNKRPEVVIFGPEVTLKTPVRILAGGEFTVTAELNDDRVTVSRITAKGEPKRKQCRLSLEDTIGTMVDLGAGYPEVVDLLKNLEDQRVLSCPVRELMPPAAVGVETLMQADLKEARVPLVEE